MRRVSRLIVLLGVVALLGGVMFGCAQGGGGGEKGVIVGIEPGAGIMKATEKAIEEYNLDFELKDSSSAAMAASLKNAIQNNEWIVVTGWTPHWKFAKWDLKYLEDPKGVYGGEEHIATIVRKGLKEDLPGVYQILDNFYWEPADMEKVMLDIEDGMPEAEAAARWVEENQDKVAEWVEGVEVANPGAEVELGYVEWDSEIASTNVVKKVLEDQGYKVTITPVDAGVMWTGVADGEFDGIVAAWLPGTHADYYAKVKDQVENLGPNLKGAKIGLVVPEYVEVNSIEELNEYKDKFQS